MAVLVKSAKLKKIQWETFICTFIINYFVYKC